MITGAIKKEMASAKTRITLSPETIFLSKKAFSSGKAAKKMMKGTTSIEAKIAKKVHRRR